jgi:hypothetical protein
MVMRQLMRFTALATLAAFLGLYAVEAFHSHEALQSSANCCVCGIASRTVKHCNVAGVERPQGVGTDLFSPATSQPPVHSVFITHGLSPPSF